MLSVFDSQDLDITSKEVPSVNIAVCGELIVGWFERLVVVWRWVVRGDHLIHQRLGVREQLGAERICLSLTCSIDF